MRTARKKMVGRACYYHACARIAGAKDDYLFTDVDKEKGMKIVQDLARLFSVEPISMCWMGNHWHIVLYAQDIPPGILWSKYSDGFLLSFFPQHVTLR